MTEKELYLFSNGTRESVINKNYTAPVRLWRKLQINEWIFSCLLFIMSLSIVLGKLYINYDSSIPGINPPSPFSPSNRRFPKTSGVQVNYLIGILNGILIFVYMCL
ncbi:uncharacterized protein LOC117602688 isoform X2 [Osmia lignaria lignaria]|uniref:uncharacterized protein LOC117602688 isoform X2 n=1 Tax=Osmia lignaria lignaria TaxID=1437193 RepID=UPI00402BA52E